jgi:surface protein
MVLFRSILNNTMLPFNFYAGPCNVGFITNVCAANCCGYKFASKAALQTAIRGYPSNQAKYGEMRCWDVSSITDMSQLFYSTSGEFSNFNEAIGCWDVSSVTTMDQMFRSAINFNQVISKWNVSRVTKMNSMFRGARKFNQAIGIWNVSRVTTMSYMFHWATNFNQPIGDWDVSRVTTMSYMLRGATKFNQPIGKWNVSKVKYMGYMLQQATSFNQDLCAWYNMLPSTATVTSMFGSSGCANPASPDFKTKSSFCQACKSKYHYSFLRNQVKNRHVTSHNYLQNHFIAIYLIISGMYKLVITQCLCR